MTDKNAMNEFFNLIKTIVDNYMKNRRPTAVVLGNYDGTSMKVGNVKVPLSMVYGNMKNKMAPGDKLRLLRNDGGHEYYILEIVGKPYYTECPEVCPWQN